jgi:hypothetical protein
MILPSFQFPGLLCFGAGFLSFITPSRCLALLAEATLMVVASSSAARAMSVSLPLSPAYDDDVD